VDQSRENIWFDEPHTWTIVLEKDKLKEPHVFSAVKDMVSYWSGENMWLEEPQI